MTFYLPIAEIEINLLVILFFGFVGSQISGIPGSQISQIWPLAGLGPGQAKLEPSEAKNANFL